MYTDRPLRFGVFLNPFHRVGLNPHLTLHRDLALAKHLEDLGYDELWYGEHHSSATETITSPELMIAAASQNTKHIRLGTGVASAPYHNPFTLAGRIVQLDHITKGRMMCGIGPGQLLQDAQMLGMEAEEMRPRMEESLDIMMRLFAGETVTHKSDWIDLRAAELQHRPYSNFEVAVTGMFSPSGPKLAGRHGASLLTLGSSTREGIEILANHWQVMQDEAARHGKTVNRANWRCLSQVYVAETMDQAIAEVDFGLRAWQEHFSHLQPGAAAPDPNKTTAQMVDAVNEAGKAVIGTPDMVIAHLRRLSEKSGGYGCFLMNGAEIARWPAMLRHYELMAEAVFPEFTGQLVPIRRAYDRVTNSGTETAEATARSQRLAREQYDKETKVGKP